MTAESLAQKTNKCINGNFNFATPTIAHSLIQGEDAEALYDAISKTIKEGIWYDEKAKTLEGSSAPLAARVDSIVRNLGQGIRVATLADLGRPEILDLIRDRFYSDAPAIVFRSTKDSLGLNSSLIEKLASIIKRKAGKLSLPVLITGFDVVPSGDRAGYGIDIVPREDFSVLHDERLSGEYNHRQFSTVDKNGLPIFDSKGSRTWHAISEGISRIYLGSNLNLYSQGSYFAGSSDDGRVVLVRDSAGAKNS